MNIALYITGTVRSNYASKFETIKKALCAEHDVTSYVYVWDITGEKLPTEQVGESDITAAGICLDSTIDINEVCRTYSTRDNYSKYSLGAISTDRYLNCHDMFVTRAAPWYSTRESLPHIRKIDRPVANISQWYLWYQCNEMRKCFGKEYDVIVRIRPDLIALEYPLPINLDTNIITSQYGSWNNPNELGGYEMGDYITIARPNDMNVWCNLYNELDNYYVQSVRENWFHRFINPHLMYNTHVDTHNLSYSCIDWKCSI